MPDPTLDDITSFFTPDRPVSVLVLRLDRLHPVISGNKWFKLKHNLEAVMEAGFKQVITFGGAYSNHLVATAAAAKACGLSSLGIVRGFHGQAQPTATLRTCADLGMRLHFISREQYALKDAPSFLSALGTSFGGYIIPEGGDNDLGRAGAMEIAAFIPAMTTHVCLPVGTGTTFTGLRNALPATICMTGFPALQDTSLADHISGHAMPARNVNWQLEPRFHFGGFAKTTPELIGFIRSFYIATNIPLDIVYTGKMMFGVAQLIRENAFPDQAQIVCIHTGGLQGNPEGLFDRTPGS